MSRRPRPEKVTLNVYDLALHNEILAPLGLGFFHSGVEVHGVEYTFGGGGGIFSHPPRRPPNGAAPSSGTPSGPLPFRAAVDMGTVEATSAEVSRVVESMRTDWRGDDYSLMSRNCNSFAEELVLRLNGRRIPGWVNRMSSLGRACSCLIPSAALEEAAPQGQGPRSGSAAGSGSRGGSAAFSSAPRHAAAAMGAPAPPRDARAEAEARALRAEAASKRIAASQQVL